MNTSWVLESQWYGVCCHISDCRGAYWILYEESWEFNGMHVGQFSLWSVHTFISFLHAIYPLNYVSRLYSKQYHSGDKVRDQHVANATKLKIIHNTCWVDELHKQILLAISVVCRTTVHGDLQLPHISAVQKSIHMYGWMCDHHPGFTVSGFSLTFWAWMYILLFVSLPLCAHTHA